MIINITTLPPVPTRSDPTNFADKADTLLAALPVFVDELNTASDQIETTQIATEAAKTAAELAQSSAETAAGAAALTAAATAWVSGFSYAAYENAIDTTDFKTYRRKSAGSSTTRPGLDVTNWALLANLGDVTLDTAQTIDGVKTFSSPIAGSTDSQVSLTGDQTIAGTKTFSSPIVGSTNSQVSLTGDQTIVGVKTITGSIKDTIVSITGNTTTLFASAGALQNWNPTGNSILTVDCPYGHSVTLQVYMTGGSWAITWSGVTFWIFGAPPTITNSQLHFVTFFNAGSGVVGSWGGRAS